MPKKSIVPFLVLLSGFVWYALFAWLQRRSPTKSDSDESVPMLTAAGAVGLLLCVLGAAIAASRLWLR
jgi:hypothetical protein